MPRNSAANRARYGNVRNKETHTVWPSSRNSLSNIKTAELSNKDGEKSRKECKVKLGWKSM